MDIQKVTLNVNDGEHTVVFVPVDEDQPKQRQSIVQELNELPRLARHALAIAIMLEELEERLEDDVMEDVEGEGCYLTDWAESLKALADLWDRG